MLSPGTTEPLPLDSPNWRPLLEAIKFICRHFQSVPRAEPKIKAALDSGDLPSVLDRPIGGRVERERLTCWKEIELELSYSYDNPREFSGSKDDIDIAWGLKRLEPDWISVWWPNVLKLCGLPVAQPAPATAPAPRHAGGKPPDPHWKRAAEYVERWIVEHRRPLPRREDGEPDKAFAMKLMLEYFERNEPKPWPADESIYRWLRANPQTWWD